MPTPSLLDVLAWISVGPGGALALAAVPMLVGRIQWTKASGGLAHKLLLMIVPAVLTVLALAGMVASVDYLVYDYLGDADRKMYLVVIAWILGWFVAIIMDLFSGFSRTRQLFRPLLRGIDRRLKLDLSEIQLNAVGAQALVADHFLAHPNPASGYEELLKLRRADLLNIFHAANRQQAEVLISFWQEHYQGAGHIRRILDIWDEATGGKPLPEACLQELLGSSNPEIRKMTLRRFGHKKTN